MRTKAVFDTNIYVSAFVFGGKPNECLELARRRDIALFVSKQLLVELARILYVKFKWSQAEVTDAMKGLAVFAQIINPRAHLRDIVNDPSDNAVLETALEAQADYIISGDKKHLLPLKKFREIPIVTAADFLKYLHKN